MLRYLLLILILSTNPTFGTFRPVDIYQPGDTVRFSISRAGKVIGSQVGVCRGIEFVEETRDSLYVFDMTTNAVFEQGGKTLESEILSKACYQKPGPPRYYEFDLKLLNARVSHYGIFAADGYSGVTTRLGVRQPFNLPLESWPALFDNNFALQWELAMNMLELPPGDSIIARLVIPQLGQMVPVAVYAEPNQVVRFDGENVSVRVLRLVEVNQVLYISHDGLLLRAEDSKSRTVVQRVTEGTQVDVDRPSFWSITQERAGPYAIFLGFAIFWAAIIGWRNELRLDALILFVAGALIYWAALRILEPLQQIYFDFAINPSSPSNTYITLFGSALLFALVEQVSILVPIAAAHFAPYKKKLPVYIAVGAACGAGFGLMQSINLTTFTPGGAVASVDLLIQKLGLVGVGTASGALFGLFLGVRASFWFYLIPIGLKAFQNWLTAFLQKGALSQGEFIVATLLIAAATLVLFYWLRFRYFSLDGKRR